MDQSHSTIVIAASTFLQALQRSRLRLQVAYPYGSHASRNPRPDSDVDVALVSEAFGDWLADQGRILGPLPASHPRIEPVRSRPAHSTDENPLAWEIKTGGIRLLQACAAAPPAPSGHPAVYWMPGCSGCLRSVSFAQENPPNGSLRGDLS